MNDSNIFFICQTVGKLSYSEKINTNFKYRKTTFKRYFHLVVFSRHVSTALLVFIYPGSIKRWLNLTQD